MPILAIHTCNGAIDVFLTPELEDLMADEGDAALFDYWVHNQFLSSRGIYNRI